MSAISLRTRVVATWRMAPRLIRLVVLAARTAFWTAVAEIEVQRALRAAPARASSAGPETSPVSARDHAEPVITCASIPTPMFAPLMFDVPTPFAIERGYLSSQAVVRAYRPPFLPPN